jgi:hypothetical protein
MNSVTRLSFSARIGGALVWLLISPIRARYFLLSAQEKVPKEKGSPAALIVWRRCPAFLATPGARTTRDLALLDSLRQGARLVPGVAAVLGECKRVVVDGFRVLVLNFPHPSGAAEHRSKGRRTLAPCLSAASCASAGLYEKRRGPAQRASLRDRLSFGYFSLAEQREVSRPNVRNQTVK